MSLFKVTVALGLVLVFVHDISTTDFSAMNFARDTLMQYSRGTERTVVELKPEFKLVEVYSEPKPKPKESTGGWPWITSFRVDPPVKMEKKLVFVHRTKTYKTRSTPSSQFLQALSEVERGVADAKAAQSWVKSFPAKLQSLKNTIKLAAEKRMFQYSRHRLGEALFLLRNSSAARPKRSTQNQASSFMDDLKVSMGPAEFDEFMAVMGDRTLMFAIDTTGSMSEEIDTAKRIAVDVIGDNSMRQNPVSYILSPFNDPSTGPVTFKDNTESGLFVDAINKLTADGGGDCAEMAIKGILDALHAGPEWGSPLYVFTDASAKDATPTNMEEVKTIAKSYKVTINFFIREEPDCASTNNPFKELAEFTSGQLLRLPNNQELQQLTGFTGSVLGGSNIISSGSNMSHRKKRRAIGDQRYSIKIDDSIEKMSVCITTERPNQGTMISLTDPRGTIIRSGKITLSKVSVYEITRPKVGTWTLVIPLSIGHYNYFVKAQSDSNIEFEYYFLFTLPRHTAEVSISQPLIGRQSKLVLTIAGYDKVQKNTVVLELITKYGEHIRDLSLTPDNEGKHYEATFTPPSRPFKLKLKGTTKAGNSFERISRDVIEPKHVLLRVLYSDKDFTLRRGQTTGVVFRLFNAAPVRKVVNVQVKDRLGYVAKLSRNTRTVRSGRWMFFSLRFKTPWRVAVGTGDTAFVSISVNNGAERSSLAFQLIVVA